MNNTLKSILLILIFILLTVSHLTAQKELSTRSRKAKKHFSNAQIHLGYANYDMAERELKQAIEYDEKFIEAYLLLSDIYLDLNIPGETLELYQKAIEINPEFDPMVYYFYAKAALKTGKYTLAKDQLKEFETYREVAADHDKEIQKMHRQCEFALKQIKNPIDFDPVNPGKNVNSRFDEYWPTVSADNRQLLFTISDRRVGSQEDCFLSVKRNDVWGEAFNLGPPINTRANEGAPSISFDGQYIFFTKCNSEDSHGSCDIFYSQKLRDNYWSNPSNLGPPVNSKNWESNAFMSPDGQSMYFVSNLDSGFGGKDIWMCRLQDDGYWSAPENLGDSINTDGNEVSPFIHPDNKTLYFSSDGWLGMGGYDIFYSRKDSAGHWSKPKNMGYPLNTYKHEESLVVDSEGKFGYISTDREGGLGGLDIYMFPVPEEARPGIVTFVKGIVYDAETKEPLGATLDLIRLSDDKFMSSLNSNPANGEFLVIMPDSANFALNVQKEGYLYFSENYDLRSLKDFSKSYQLEVPLQPIKVGAKSILKNVFFDTDSYKLKPESKTELNRLVTFLNDNPGISIELGGHTDSRASAEYNMQLSQNRAKAVYQYLTGKGIDKKRLSYKGYGLTQPIASNETEEGMAKNRRTEMKVVEE
jgi:outer membrane protein OmpA-like peptidoglycan-associated protein